MGEAAHARSTFLATLFLAFAALFALQNAVSPAYAHARSDWRDAIVAREPIEGVTPDVQYDKYSLVIKGQRVFLHSGEFHTFRLPVPSLWPDILQKAKAAGLNSVSVYLHMGLTNPAPGVVDFEGYRALAPLYEAAQEAGIWIVLRPGPYINAETTAGGIAHWATSEVAGKLRTNATDWKEAWQAYIKGVIEETEPYQISCGGPVIAIQIDNEYTQNPPSHAGYFQDLIDVYDESDIDVLLTYNDFGGGKSFYNGTGSVDLVGLDSYPQGFDCSHPLNWTPVVTDYYQYHLEVNSWQPWYIPEFQGGSFDAWGPTAPGFDACRILTGPDFQSVFNLQLWASNAKLINYYMFYGGTSWGGTPHPGVYTSYDYGASIAESRELSAKYDEIKRQSLFIRSSPAFYKTDWVADSSTGLEVSSNDDVYITHLKNPDEPTSFYIARHRDSTSNVTAAFRLNVTTELGSLSIPLYLDNITLAGRQSRVIVTDYSYGASAYGLVYSTSPVFFAGVIGGRDVLLLYGDSAQSHEATFYSTFDNSMKSQSPLVKVQQTKGSLGSEKRSLVTSTIASGFEGLVTLVRTETQLVLFADTATAATFWSPTIAGKADDPFRNYWGIGTNETVLVGGPYLVRNATLEGEALSLQGDLKDDVQLTIIGPPHLQSISWNGQNLTFEPSLEFSIGDVNVYVADLKVASSLDGLQVPKLEGWKYKDSLPEIETGYDDSSWTIANHTTTNIPYKPYYGDGRVLYGCDYGFCENVVLWRGHFKASGTEKSVNLSINGGTAFAASVWLNDVFLGTSFGNSTNNRNIIQETDDKFTFPDGAIIPGKDNVITVVQDNTGLNQTSYDTYDGDTSKSPRGIRGFQLDTGEFGDWKVQGKVGGYKDFPDKVRGILNEGGLFGERAGWHLPGFPTEGWEERDLASGLPNKTAGIGFFVTNFTLDVPTGLDVMFSFDFEQELGQPYRAFLFVNGWMMGKRIANLGPQSKFPVHEGILNYHGENTVAVGLWTMTPGETAAPKLELKLNAAYEGGVGNVEVNNPKWSSSDRRPTK
ncbi:glycoside hydrolase family 35 protein [Ephemerocybe angulata]|uniref:beta-galactosidase n=1 Tax=Ephemerocybe angulata TaxID=980116 RepID=A0A8H6LYS5_9AGAR|nr:glycoside hydrolase family 35 protein [Tulosesus angulatus]